MPVEWFYGEKVKAGERGTDLELFQKPQTVRSHSLNTGINLYFTPHTLQGAVRWSKSKTWISEQRGEGE